ncbi:hypothetical protein HMPREF9622_01168 [Cutibacterium modestum HL037PA3]|nr:hypothetical protein HMPREF9621_00781 [Cutibacterium modestum HL037PA2]EFT15739.1 hypothetical protein HMPREF9622_01168 [Cutibacterium modestum HL037PA3]
MNESASDILGGLDWSSHDRSSWVVNRSMTWMTSVGRSMEVPCPVDVSM